jgi:hypothetical protein
VSRADLVARLETDAQVLRKSKRTTLQVIAGDVEAAITLLSAAGQPAAPPAEVQALLERAEKAASQVPGRPELLRSVVMAGGRWKAVVRWLREVVHG